MKSIDIIKNSILEINSQLKKKDKIKFNKNFEILGKKNNLDSLILVNLFTTIEEKIKNINGKEIVLLSEDFFKQSFKKNYTIANLEKDIDKKLKKK
tara:strand:- start:1093 stop:1380 length:288 start_codon:yes stop_codon:yes gene_type:complete